MQPESSSAILERRKTQTRRPAKVSAEALAALDAGGRVVGLLEPDGAGFVVEVVDGRYVPQGNHAIRCPYGGPRGRLWVRERWTPANDHPAPAYAIQYGDDTIRAGLGDVFGDPRSPIFMPRWASRLTLTITELRLQRVQAITEADAIAEGAFPEFEVDVATFVRGRALPPSTHVLGYKHAWNRLHGPGAWDLNPPVWAITFEISEVHQ